MMTIGILAFVVALLVSVMLHEAGHFVTAKLFGMKATQFFVGFGTTLWSRQRGETEYGVKAIPAGGFVKIIGMTPLEDVPVEDQPRAFINKPGWQRFIVLIAGSTMHFIIALVLLLILLLGWPSVLHGASQVQTVENCVTVSANEPCPAGAALAPAVGKFKPNDVITAVNGEAIVSPKELAMKISAMKPGDSVKVSIVRDGKEQTLTPKLAPLPGEKTFKVGRDDGKVGGTFGLQLAPATDVGGAGNEGVVVAGVDPKGLGAEQGIRQGDVILEIAGKRVSEPARVKAAIDEARKDGRKAVLMRLKSGEDSRFVALAFPKKAS